MTRKEAIERLKAGEFLEYKGYEIQRKVVYYVNSDSNMSSYYDTPAQALTHADKDAG